MAQWRRTLDPAVLWPGSTRAERVSAYGEIVEAARRILAGGRAALTAATPTAVNAAGIAAFVSGMGPLLGWWLEQGSLTTTSPALQALLSDHLAHGRRRVEHLTQRLAWLLPALAARGIVPTVLKGTYTGRRYFADPGVRPTSDIDLLVQAAEFSDARDALQSLGLTCLANHTLPHREDWGLPGADVVQSLEMTHEGNPWSVDLHSSLDRRYFPGLIAGFGTPGAADLESWTGPFGAVRVPAQPLLAAHLAVHAGAEYPHVQLIRVVELVLVLRADLASGRLTRDALRDLFRRTGTRRFAYPAMALAAQLSPETVDQPFVSELAQDATPRMRRTLAEVATVPPSHFLRESLDMRLAWAKGPFELLANVAEWIYPTGPATTARTRLAIWRRRLRLLATGRVGWRSDDGNGTRP